MKKLSKYLLLFACLAALVSCGKEEQPVTPPDDNPSGPVTPDTPKQIDYTKYNLGDLAALQGIKLGAAFTYGEYAYNSQVAEILTREFKAVTFGNEMKHDAIVQSNGQMRFFTADQMVEWAKKCGTELFGHVLGWHSQQQRSYLNAVIAQAAANAPADTNPPAPIGGVIDFENYTAGASSQILESREFVQINGPDHVAVTGEFAHSGSLSLMMDNSDNHCVDSWDVQVITKTFPVTAGKTYRIAWYARASSPADMQIDIRGDGDVKYKNSAWGQFDKMTTEWTYQYLDYAVQSGKELSFAFYGGTEAVTYYLDDIQLIGEADTTGPAVHEAVDAAFKSYVYGMVEHFDVYAWDVVNETFADGAGGAFRTQGNTANDFVWGNYYDSTKDWVDAAFAYATDACAKYGKSPILYINDYNLETDASKRKALCNYAKNNPQVTGVASQMHLDMAIPDLKSKVEASLKDLVATGKMVRISELDLKTTDETAQADMFKHIFQKYIEIVPPAQRGGITFWGINDKDSWVGENNAPLLWKGKNYDRKAGYEALYLYLCEVNGLSPYKE